MKRVVVDTNIILSAYLWGGTPLRFINFAVNNSIILLTSDDILGEFEETLNKSKFDGQLLRIQKTRQQIVEEYIHITVSVVPSTIPENVVRDPKDKIILAAADGGNADAIVSGDNHLLEIKVYNNILILTVTEFLDRYMTP